MAAILMSESFPNFYGQRYAYKDVLHTHPCTGKKDVYGGQNENVGISINS